MLLTMYLGSFIYSYLNFQNSLDKCENKILKENENKEIKENSKKQAVLKELSILICSLTPIFNFASVIYIKKHFDEFYNYVKELEIFEIKKNDNLEIYRYLLKSGISIEEIKMKRKIGNEVINNKSTYPIDALENYLDIDDSIKQVDNIKILNILDSYLEEEITFDSEKIRILK